MKYERGEQESLTEAVVFAVAEAEDCKPTDLPPLTDALDSDALETLCGCTVDGEPRKRVFLSFFYSDSQVTIKDSTTVEVGPKPIV